jgi:hypothetical protein
MTSELYAVVAAQRLDEDEAKRIADESRRADVMRLDAERVGRKGPWLLEMPGVHEILVEGTEWDAVSWTLNESGVERLARTFEWLEDELPGEFTFEVLWGDEPIDKLVSREELVRIVRTGRIGGRTRYRVMPSPT